MAVEFKVRRVTSPNPVRQAVTDYARGPLALIPAIILLLIIRAYSALGEWDQGQVFALSLGMTGSMLITSGFTQAVARRGSIYLGLEDTGAASRFLRMSMTVAGACVVIVASAAFLVTTYLGVFTLNERVTFGLAFVGLAAIWLIAAGLSLVQATGWLGISMAVGIIVGVITERAAAVWSGAHLELGTTVGFAVSVGLMLYVLNRGLDAKSNEHPSKVVLPSAAYLVYEAAPYFAYGLLYMIFILAPHALGWYGRLEPDQTQSSAVAAVELGLTLSLLPVMLVGGVAEHALRLFWLQARKAQATTPGTDLERFGRTLAEYHRGQLQLYLAILAGGSLLIYFVFQAALHAETLSSVLPQASWNAAELIFMAGLIAYCLLGWGLFNCMFCITLARPTLALRAVAIGLVVMLLVGVPLSLGLHFTNVGVTFITGAAAFTAASSSAVRRIFNSADHFYFSSL